MAKENRVVLHVKSIGENVALVRMVASGFLFPYDLTMEELDEIKIALSEAVTNCIVHGYEEQENQEITVTLEVREDMLMLQVEDTGVGIIDIAQAMLPAFSTREEHMGLGFVFMQTFMDDVSVQSTPGEGTTVTMWKRLPQVESEVSAFIHETSEETLEETLNESFNQNFGEVE